MYPFVSILTPTYNRRKFLPSLIQCYLAQDYPHDRMEWIILDDGEDGVKDVFAACAKTIPNLKYIYTEDKLLIGAKRNRLNAEARGSILIAMDDDDYYCPTRVSHVVETFRLNPHIDVAGCSELYIYFTDNQKIYHCGPHGKNHATNGTMAWRKSYADRHRYDERIARSEEGSFLNSYTTPIVQLDPRRVMLVMNHGDNTVDKVAMRKSHAAKETQLTLSSFIASPSLRKAYETDE